MRYNEAASYLNYDSCPLQNPYCPGLVISIAEQNYCGHRRIDINNLRGSINPNASRVEHGALLCMVAAFFLSPHVCAQSTLAASAALAGRVARLKCSVLESVYSRE